MNKEINEVATGKALLYFLVFCGVLDGLDDFAVASSCDELCRFVFVRNHEGIIIVFLCFRDEISAIDSVMISKKLESNFQVDKEQMRGEKSDGEDLRHLSVPFGEKVRKTQGK